MDLRRDLNDDEAEDYYKKIKLIYNSLETAKDLIFITKGLNNKYIKQFNQEHIKEIPTIKEIEEISGNYTYEDIHTNKENCDKMKFETYTDDEINDYDTYWSDDSISSYNNEDYLQNYIDESFDGTEEEWEDYCEDIAERYDWKAEDNTKNKRFEKIDFSILGGSYIEDKKTSNLYSSLYNKKSIKILKEEVKFAGASFLGGFLISGIANLFGLDIDDEIATTIAGANILKRKTDNWLLENENYINSNETKNNGKTLEELCKELNEENE